MNADPADTTTVSSAYASRGDLPDPDDRPVRIGRYLPLRRLGQGGMGVVYEAVDPTLGRRVAVKVLHRERPGDGDLLRARRRRLLREAQAMARLSHPNVLPVFDVGESGSDLFLAMELVAGRSLADWLGADRRGWRETVSVFSAAGRGLAAAHAAGVIHRDFKPGNVLVGDDGQVRVVDFGLARNADSIDRDDSGATDAPSVPGDDEVVARTVPEPLTTAGAVLGTPAFMSPEQRRGAHADARSDQYSFCISLWLALGGDPPAGDAIAGAPRGPRRLRRALLRGLRADPRGRHGSMDGLLRELDRLLRRRRRWASAAAGAGALGLAAVAVLAASADRPEACHSAERKLAGVWDDAARRALRREFAGSGYPAAEANARRVIARVDGYAASWAAMRTEACEATRVHGEQSETLLDLRMQCLDRRLSQLDAMVTVLREQPSADVVAGAVDAAWRLDPLDGCADWDLLERPVPLPPEPARRERVEQVRASLDRAAALLKAGRYAAGRDLAGFAVGAAERLDYPPLEAEALLLHGELLDQAGEAAEAEQVLRAAAHAAAEAADDERLATAWVSLVYVVGMTRARHQEALQLADLAAAAATRARNDRIRGLLANHLGAVQSAIGRYPEAESSFRRATGIARDGARPGSPGRGQLAGLDRLGAGQPGQARRGPGTTRKGARDAPGRVRRGASDRGTIDQQPGPPGVAARRRGRGRAARAARARHPRARAGPAPHRRRHLAVQPGRLRGGAQRPRRRGRLLRARPGRLHRVAAARPSVHGARA